MPAPRPALLDVRLLPEATPLVVLDDGIIRRRARLAPAGQRISAADLARPPATRTISGRVTDAQGHGLPGATVQLKGTTTTATTDSTGAYALAGVPLEKAS